MRGKSFILLFAVASFVLPEVLKKCKPVAKIVGDTLVTAGEVFQKVAQPEPAATVTTVATAEPVAETPAEPAAPVEEAPTEFVPPVDFGSADPA